MKTATAPLPPLRSVKVLDQLRERIRYLHYSLPTEQAYVHWVRAFIRFHGVRHPATLGSSEVEAFLSWLANERKVSVSTHRQALAALLFFYGKGAVHRICPGFREIGRPRPSRRLPVVLTPDEVVRILGFWKASIVCSPSFCMERACGSVRVCNCGSGSGFRSRHDHRAGGQGLQDRADVTRELGTQPARAAVACTGMVAEGPGRGPQRRCASRRP